MNRRTAIKSIAAGLSATTLGNNPFAAMAAKLRGKTILVLSGWQYHNIGDIAHTPGLLQLLNKFLPECRIILWKARPNHQVEKMLKRAFPGLKVVHGDIDEGSTDSESLLEASREADFLLHGSGPSIVGAKQLFWWKDQVKKPYGIYGVTVGNVNDRYRKLIDDCSFLFTRETKSIEVVKHSGANPPILDLGPDATFAMHLTDPLRAAAFLEKKRLMPGKFICVIPRLRRTPYYDLYPDWGWSDERIREIDSLNDKYKESDHAKAREAIITYVRETGNKVLVCPEMTYQIGIQRELLVDPLPIDVRRRVVTRDSYWLCDEAASVYREAAAVISFECHSPIMACFNGTPAFYLRQPEDTIKGQMWYDIGLEDWVFEIEDSDGKDIADKLMEIVKDPESARLKVESTMDFVRGVQRDNFRKMTLK